MMITTNKTDPIPTMASMVNDSDDSDDDDDDCIPMMNVVLVSSSATPSYPSLAITRTLTVSEYVILLVFHVYAVSVIPDTISCHDNNDWD